MVKNVTYHNPIHQEENTPLVTILEVRTDLKQATAVDSRKSPYNVNLAKASFGATHYPLPGSQWYLKKISGVWTLMARAPQQNPQLNPGLTPVPGDTYIGGEGTTNIVGDLNVTGSISAGGVTVDPEIGTIKICASNTPPTGWMICDGSAVSRTTYAQMFSIIGTAFGVGDGSTTFNIPNIKGRMAVGRDSGQVEFDTLGETGGSKTITLTTTELPAHTHTVGTLVNAAEAAHTHSVSATTGGISANHTHAIGADHDTASGGFGWSLHNNSPSGAGTSFATGTVSSDHTHSFSTTSGAGASHNHTISGSTATAGTGSAFASLPPYIVINFIIKAAGVFTPPASSGTIINATVFNAVGSVSTDIGYTATVAGDVFKRFSIDDAGKQVWGTGAALADTNLYRSGVGILSTDGSLVVGANITMTDKTKQFTVGTTGISSATIAIERGATTDFTFTSFVTGDTNRRYRIKSDGTIDWGGGVSVADTNLYRSAANLLRTDDTFQCASLLVDDNTNFPNSVFVQAIPNQAITSTTYVDVTNMSVSFTKTKAGTKVRMAFAGTCYMSAQASYYYAFQINGTDYLSVQYISTVITGTRQPCAGFYYLSGLAAGTYTVKLRAKVTSSTLNMDSSDIVNLEVQEVK